LIPSNIGNLGINALGEAISAHCWSVVAELSDFMLWKQFGTQGIHTDTAVNRGKYSSEVVEMCYQIIFTFEGRIFTEPLANSITFGPGDLCFKIDEMFEKLILGQELF
jgi:hypothetical protein